ncbi:hypothetical protein ASE66_25550 [Bosea sp. Root483D1]|uniref:hypothetical protein n=1 Tax=Bosea sp. Root483D1 TaxID=1736544 RepID=UPI00070BD94C|nr:hypothetical protein [Bosea sp. Root483D1]KRE22559.1 hypothetical protein ASE66_25550 [Bosea sp. Root483D1]
MPVRKRKSKARTSDVAAWAEFLMWGRDFFDELAAVGHSSSTAMPLAEKVWHEIGDQVIAYIDEMHRGFTPPTRPFWAEREFGPPGGKRKLQRR